MSAFSFKYQIFLSSISLLEVKFQFRQSNQPWKIVVPIWLWNIAAIKSVMAQILSLPSQTAESSTQSPAQQVGAAAASQPRCKETHNMMATQCFLPYKDKYLCPWGPKGWGHFPVLDPAVCLQWLWNVHYITLCTYCTWLCTIRLRHIRSDKSPGSSGVYKVKRSQLVSLTDQLGLTCHFLAHSPAWLCQERHSRAVYEPACSENIW